MSNKYLNWSQAALPKHGQEKQPLQEQKQHLYPSRAVRTENPGSQWLHLQTSPGRDCKGTPINSCHLPASPPKEKSAALQLSTHQCQEGFQPHHLVLCQPKQALSTVLKYTMKWPQQLQAKGCAVQFPQLDWCLAGATEEHYFIIWNAKQICFNLIQCWS